MPCGCVDACLPDQRKPFPWNGTQLPASAIDQSLAARLGLSLHVHLESSRRRLLPRLRLALQLRSGRQDPYDLIADVVVGLSSLEAAAGRARASEEEEEDEDPSGGGGELLPLPIRPPISVRVLPLPLLNLNTRTRTAVVPVTTYAPWAKAQALVPAWSRVLRLPTVTKI